MERDTVDRLRVIRRRQRNEHAEYERLRLTRRHSAADNEQGAYCLQIYRYKDRLNETGETQHRSLSGNKGRQRDASRIDL